MYGSVTDECNVTGRGLMCFLTNMPNYQCVNMQNYENKEIYNITRIVTE